MKISELGLQGGDLVDLKPNDTFKNKLYEVIMLKKDSILIDLSTNGNHITAEIPATLVAKKISRKDLEQVSEENEGINRILEKVLFNEFDD